MHGYHANELREAAPTVISGFRLALLFTVGKSINNGEWWETWLTAANYSPVQPPRIFIHAHALRTPEHRAAFQPAYFAQFVVDFTFESGYTDGCARNLSAAQRLLARHALDDPMVTHLAAVSEACIPVKSLSWMYE